MCWPHGITDDKRDNTQKTVQFNKLHRIQKIADNDRKQHIGNSFDDLVAGVDDRVVAHRPPQGEALLSMGEKPSQDATKDMKQSRGGNRTTNNQ